MHCFSVTERAGTAYVIFYSCCREILQTNQLKPCSLSGSSLLRA